MSDRLTFRLLGPRGGEDPGCEKCLARLHIWAEGVAAGMSGEDSEPSVAIHLRSCPDCAEDAEGLVALIAAKSDPS